MQLSLTLGVADLQRTADFYREILQLNPQRNQSRSKPDFLLLRCGETCVVFRQPLGVGLQLELSCSDLSVVRNCIERYQWPVVYELEDDEHRRSEIWLQDPDGYLLVLNEEP